MDQSWNSDNRDLLIRSSVGLAATPLDIDAIRRSRAAQASYIERTFSLSSDDVVLDLGSGPGYIARLLASKVKHIHCADISKGYLALCREEVAGLNVTCHLIPFADLSSLYDAGITAIYASAVFLHFNIYDVCLYLEEFFRLLPSTGRVWLDFMSATDLAIGHGHFRRHMQFYKNDRSEIALVLNYHHPDVIEGIAQQIGFQTKRFGDGNHRVLILAKTDAIEQIAAVTSEEFGLLTVAASAPNDRE